MSAKGVDQELLALALATVSEGSLITDADRKTIYANPAFTQITGYEQSEILGENCRFLQGPDTSPVELQRLREALDHGEVFEGNLLNYRRDRTTFWNHLTITPLKDSSGRITNFVSVQRDVTQQVKERDALSHQAAHDQLTGLPNREELRRHIRKEIGEASEDGSTLAVAMIDLDDFKLVNDQLGHLAGDAVLSEFAARMNERLRSTEFLARLGGDEFVIVASELSPVDPLAEFAKIASRLHEVVESPFPVGDNRVASIGMSMGVALFPRDGATGRELMRAADIALYRVKAGTSPTHWWEAAIDQVHEGNEADVTARHIPAGELVMFMQPIVDLGSGEVSQVEALARILTPAGDLEGPDSFLPHYSQQQLVEVFKEGLEQALKWASRWDDGGIAMNVSVNVPPELLNDPASADWVRDALARHSVDPHRLSLEVLETQEVDLEASDKTVGELVRLGVKMHLDDLSSGFSTLKRLTDMPFDVIKIDRRIFDQAHTRALHVLTVLAAITKLGADLGYGTVVEGIENRERLELSAVLGAQAGQGFLFARPMPPEEISTWLKQFSMPYRQGELTTALGALAYHWSHGGGTWPDHPAAAEECPLTDYLKLSEASADAELLAAHRVLHEDPVATPRARVAANATMLARLVAHVQHGSTTE